MAQEHQEYIQQKVNPVLENLVTQLLLERPEQLAPFMIKWLSEHAKTPGAAALTEGVNVLSELKAELERLEEEVQRLEAEVGRQEKAAPKPPAGEPEEEEEEEEEDEEEEAAVLPPPAEYLKRGPRSSVSAEAYGQWNKPKEFTPPVYPKSDEQKARLRAKLQESFLFSALDGKEIEVVILAMQEKPVEKDDKVITQGDDGDSLFVIDEGQMDVFKDDKKVKECKSGDAFGELALLYNCPRAASVVAHEKGLLWMLDRDTFNHIVKRAASQKRQRYEDFLKKVPLLESMQAYERQTLCDALQSLTVAQGESIIKQGTVGDVFYIVEEGECVAEKVFVEGTQPKEVKQYRQGDYFGELALLNDEPRAATVNAKSDCKLLSLSRKTFKTMLGPLEDILKRNATQYN